MSYIRNITFYIGKYHILHQKILHLTLENLTSRIYIRKYYIFPRKILYLPSHIYITKSHILYPTWSEFGIKQSMIGRKYRRNYVNNKTNPCNTHFQHIKHIFKMDVSGHKQKARENGEGALKRRLYKTNQLYINVRVLEILFIQ